MPSTPQPPSSENLAKRPFAFYPAILNIEHNEWAYRQSTWSEIMVRNTASGTEVWIPRRFLGEISRIEEPVMIVGLRHELEYKAGSVWSHEKRVIAMPGGAPPAAPSAEATISSEGRSTTPAESRIGRLIAIVFAAGVAFLLLLLLIFRETPTRTRIVFTSRDQSFLELGAKDDYFAVVRKLGVPEADRWRSETGELQYRLLWYPQRSYFVILMGTERKDAHYIGALDKDWRMVHFVEFAQGQTTAAMLRTLPKF